jgi:hypothetical protein
MRRNRLHNVLCDAGANDNDLAIFGGFNGALLSHRLKKFHNPYILNASAIKDYSYMKN